MTYRFKPGDHIRVSRIEGSTWQDRHGIVVDVIVRDGNELVQECAVSLDGDRRWFLASHLNRTVPPQMIRFFRSEALDRWKLNPDKTAQLNGDWDQLMELLCEHYDLPMRRAALEVESFYNEFDRKTAPLITTRSRQTSDAFMGSQSAA
jgi:hypothetical protein